jgi:poly(3-hydroxybutyrate) depolymerase
MRSWTCALFGVIFIAVHACAAPLPSGPSRIEFPLNGVPFTLFTYKPAGYKDGPLLVVFHGVVRNAEDYRNFAIPMADRFGALLVAPLLDPERFPEEWYQRGGLLDAKGKARPPEQWMFTVVEKIVADVRARENKPDLPYYLIGHSAGAQFLIRLAAYDTTPRRRFDASEAGMKQGPHRLARNRNGFELAQKIARERGWTFNWRKVETPGIEHDAAAMFAAKEVEDALFGPK